MPPSPRPPRGFSLLQISLSLLALTVAASIAIPLWFSRGNVTLENAASLMARDLRHAQDLAVMGNEELTFVFEQGGDGYRVQDATGAMVPAPLGPGKFQRLYSRDAVFRGVRFAAVEAGPKGAIRIAPTGLLQDPGHVVLEFGGSRQGLTIEAGDGQITPDVPGER